MFFNCLLKHNTNAIPEEWHEFYSATDAGPADPPHIQCEAATAIAEVQQNRGRSINVLFRFKLLGVGGRSIWQGVRERINSYFILFYLFVKSPRIFIYVILRSTLGCTCNCIKSAMWRKIGLIWFDLKSPWSNLHFHRCHLKLSNAAVERDVFVLKNTI